MPPKLPQCASGRGMQRAQQKWFELDTTVLVYERTLHMANDERPRSRSSYANRTRTASALWPRSATSAIQTGRSFGSGWDSFQPKPAAQVSLGSSPTRDDYLRTRLIGAKSAVMTGTSDKLASQGCAAVDRIAGRNRRSRWRTDRSLLWACCQGRRCDPTIRDQAKSRKVGRPWQGEQKRKRSKFSRNALEMITQSDRQQATW